MKADQVTIYFLFDLLITFTKAFLILINLSYEVYKLYVLFKNT